MKITIDVPTALCALTTLRVCADNLRAVSPRTAATFDAAHAALDAARQAAIAEWVPSVVDDAHRLASDAIARAQGVDE